MKKFLLFAILAVFTLSACQKTTHFEDLTMKMENNQLVLYKDGKKFSGEVWSTDKRVCDKVTDGKIDECIFYHKNGEVAGKTADGKSDFYDEDGRHMSEIEFGQKYLNDFDSALSEFSKITLQP